LDDELDVLRSHALNGFLNDVVAVLVFDTSEYIILELFYEKCLLVG